MESGLQSRCDSNKTEAASWVHSHTVATWPRAVNESAGDERGSTMASENEPHVNDDGAAGDQAELPNMPAATLSQLVGDYAVYLRGVVATMDAEWTKGLRPKLNLLIHALEKEAAVQ